MEDINELVSALEELTQATRRTAENIRELRAIFEDRPDNHIIEEGYSQISSNKENCQEAV